jgi:hypothetical protein
MSFPTLRNLVTAIVACSVAGFVACPAMSQSEEADLLDAKLKAAELQQGGIAGGNCLPAPCKGDLTGDRVVGAADLANLLAAWGQCPAVLANEVCSDAVPITEGSYPFCNVGATTDGPTHPECLYFGDNNVGSDVWFIYEATEDGLLTVGTCGSADYDTKIAVYQEVLIAPNVGLPCPAPPSNPPMVGAILVGCNDDADGCGLQSRVAVEVSAGFHYTIRVGGYLGAQGNGTLNVQFERLGDACANCIALDGVSYQEVVGETVSATSFGGDVSSCALNDVTDQWYCFVLPGTCGLGSNSYNLTVSTCHPDTNFDTTLAVYEATCDGLVELGCNDDFASDNACLLNGLFRKSRVQVGPLLTGETYYIRVSGYNQATGCYRLGVSAICIPGSP